MNGQTQQENKCEEFKGIFETVDFSQMSVVWEEPTMQIRLLKRADAPPVLQQLFAMHVNTTCSYVWKDVPIVEEE